MVINDRIFIFGWTIPLNESYQFPLLLTPLLSSRKKLRFFILVSHGRVINSQTMFLKQVCLNSFVASCCSKTPLNGYTTTVRVHRKTTREPIRSPPQGRMEMCLSVKLKVLLHTQVQKHIVLYTLFQPPTLALIFNLICPLRLTLQVLHQDSLMQDSQDMGTTHVSWFINSTDLYTEQNYKRFCFLPPFFMSWTQRSKTFSMYTRPISLKYCSQIFLNLC